MSDEQRPQTGPPPEHDLLGGIDYESEIVFKNEGGPPFIRITMKNVRPEGDDAVIAIVLYPALLPALIEMLRQTGRQYEQETQTSIMDDTYRPGVRTSEADLIVIERGCPPPDVCHDLIREIRRLRKALNDEIADLRMISGFASTVYDEITGGRISKSNTMPEQVIAQWEQVQADDYVEWLQELVQYGLEDAFPGWQPEQYVAASTRISSVSDCGDFFTWLRILMYTGLFNTGRPVYEGRLVMQLDIGEPGAVSDIDLIGPGDLPPPAAVKERLLRQAIADLQGILEQVHDDSRAVAAGTPEVPEAELGQEELSSPAEPAGD